MDVSHGRGGAGNFGTDSTQYVDGDIHREGNPSASGGAYSTGRGGASNIASPKQKAVNSGDDVDVVPEQSKMRTPQNGRVSTGRGGEGNIIEAKTVDGKHVLHKTLGEKLKEVIHHEHSK